MGPCAQESKLARGFRSNVGDPPEKHWKGVDPQKLAMPLRFFKENRKTEGLMLVNERERKTE